MRASKAKTIIGKTIFIISQFYNNQMQSLKSVDKFQFIQEESISDREVAVIPAWHTILNRAYTLKQIIIGQNTKGRHAALLREANILKSISGDWVIKCHKMMRTTHNVYLVYDRFGDLTLQEYLTAPRRLQGTIEKQELAVKLIGLLIFLKESNVVNLNILPRNIEVIEKQPKENVEIFLRINNFQSAFFTDEGFDRSILETLLINQFHPPQLVATPPIIGQHCQIYTIGKILQKLYFTQNQNNELRQNPVLLEKTHKIEEMINKMTVLDHMKRIKYDQLSQFYTYFSTKKHNRIHKNKTMLNIPLIERSRSSNRLHWKRSLNQDQTQQDQAQIMQQKTLFKQIGLKVTKRRNLAIFLISCSRTISSLQYVQYEHTILLSFLLLKKSTQMITLLFKFLNTRSDIGLKIAQKDMKRYTKQQQFHTLQSIIQAQMSLSKAKLNMYLQKIRKDCPQLLNDRLFKKETQSEQINDEYLGDRIILIIKILLQNKCIRILSKEDIKHLLLMSYVKEFKTFQNMFNELINQSIPVMYQQTLFVQLEKLEKQQIINKIQSTLQQNK